MSETFRFIFNKYVGVFHTKSLAENSRVNQGELMNIQSRSIIRFNASD